MANSNERPIFRHNPLDFETDVAIGLTLPLTNDSSIRDKFLTVPELTGIGTGSMVDDQGLHSQPKEYQGDFNLSYTTLEQSRSNLINLVLTNKGERLMHPQYGCDIYALLFENINNTILKRIEDNIFKQVEIWLDYINILGVDIKKSERQENRVDIKIKFCLYEDYMNYEEITLNNIGNL